MSGSVPAPSATDYMSLGNNVTANAGNPLKTLQGWQGLANGQVQQAEGIQSIRNAQTQNQQAQFSLGVAATNRYAQAAASAMGPDANYDSALAAINHVYNSSPKGPLETQAYQQALNDLPPKTQADGTPTPASAFNKMALQHLQTALTAQEQLISNTPGYQITNTGGAMVPTVTPSAISRINDPNAPTTFQGGSVPTTLAPQIITRVDPNAGGPGIPGQVQTPVGGAYGTPPAGPGTQGAPQGGIPVPENILPPNPDVVPQGPGGLTAPLPPWLNPQTGGVTTPPGTAPQAPVQAAPPPSQINPWSSQVPIGAQESIQQNQQAYRTAQGATAPLQLQNTQLAEAHDAIARLSSGTVLPGTGMFSTYINKARQIVSDLGGDPSNVIDAQTADKYLSMAIANKAPGSDARQALLEHANPTVGGMVAGASLPIIRQLVAGNRAQQLLVDTVPDKDTAQPGSTFLNYQGTMQKQFTSPAGLAALSFDMMPASQKAQYISSDGKKFGPKLNTPAAQSTFQNVLRMAHSDGLLNGTPQAEGQ